MRQTRDKLLNSQYTPRTTECINIWREGAVFKFTKAAVSDKVGEPLLIKTLFYFPVMCMETESTPIE